uniref:immunoglobulin lambda-1 light chain-like isoform X4 n=1 Tax=Podarcis muralis TaxID=64176 RepID=UPI0010A0A6C7|nr:immunoglobulin lambda-1 light chain-like isoform X4 [Podarcis muralis]
MSSFLFLLPLFLYCSGVTCQSICTQPASESLAPGQTIKLSCTTSDTGDAVRWFQQRSGQAPRFVQYEGGSRGEGIPDRFTASRSGNTGYLTITNVQAGDEAVYHCGRWYGNTFVFGGGTHLTVLGQPTVPPTVNVFPPSPEELKSSDKATLVCLIDGFYPGVVQVTWQADGTPISSGVETTTPTKLNDKYAASSYLSMKKSDWESYEAVICKVTHEGKTVEKVVRRLDCA